MAMATDLFDASELSAAQMNIYYLAGTLRTRIRAFATAASLLFEDQTPNDRPVGNWLVLIDGLNSQLPVSIPLGQFSLAWNYVARMCIAAFTARANSLISVSQAAALLVIWNAQFGS